MKRSYEINYGNKATLNTGNYENLNPMFNIKVIIDGVEYVPEEVEVNLQREFERIKGIVDDQLQQKINEVKQGELIKALKHIRFYEKDGIKYPSVTSVLSPDPIEGVPNLELYGLRGDIMHRWFAEIVTTGKSDYFISDAEKDKLVIIGGMEGFDISWVVDDKQFEFDRSEVEVFNYKDIYAGRYDADGLLGGKTALFDVKSGDLSKAGIEKAFIQMSAYAHCVPDIKQLVVLPCNPKAKKVPVVSTDIDKFYAMFMQKRAEFKERFGI
jgi:hypothetical protein